MSKDLSAHIFSGPIPEIRRDLEIIPIQHNGSELLYFHDSLGYIKSDFALDASVAPLLNLFTGILRIEDMASILNNQLQEDDLKTFISLLDENLVLNSQNYRQVKNLIEDEYEASTIRKPALAGLSYPEDALEFQKFIFNIIEKNKKPPVSEARALFAPHIDLNVGSDEYAEAFSQLINLKPARVVILATAHYAGYYGDFYAESSFIGSDKTFRLPGRNFEPDKMVLDQLLSGSPGNGFTLNDRAHRVEHSIEMHLLFASAIWQHNFSIVPILVSGFDELYYVRDGELNQRINLFAEQLNHFIDDETFILISGDLSHVGKKFGDPEPAVQLRQQVEEFDDRFLETSSGGDSSLLLDLISEEYDKTRVCGFPPLYTFLKMRHKANGKRINYQWWDEKERESAVSFGSILF